MGRSVEKCFSGREYLSNGTKTGPGGTCMALRMVIIRWLHKYFVETCKNETSENANMKKKKPMKFQVC